MAVLIAGTIGSLGDIDLSAGGAVSVGGDGQVSVGGQGVDVGGGLGETIKKVAGGVAAGTAIGAVAGPIGAAVGGAIGGAYAALSGVLGHCSGDPIGCECMQAPGLGNGIGPYAECVKNGIAARQAHADSADPPPGQSPAETQRKQYEAMVAAGYFAYTKDKLDKIAAQAKRDAAAGAALVHWEDFTWSASPAQRQSTSAYLAWCRTQNGAVLDGGNRYCGADLVAAASEQAQQDASARAQIERAAAMRLSSLQAEADRAKALQAQATKRGAIGLAAIAAAGAAGVWWWRRAHRKASR